MAAGPGGAAIIGENPGEISLPDSGRRGTRDCNVAGPETKSAPSCETGLPVAMILVDALTAYAVAGLIIAIAFVVFGVAQVLPADTPVTVGARILVPGAAVLWPFVLGRWLRLRGRR